MGPSGEALGSTWPASGASSTTFSGSSLFSNSLESWQLRGISEVFFSSNWAPGSTERPLLHSTVLAAPGPGLASSRATFLCTGAAMRMRVTGWKRLRAHFKRGYSQHNHWSGLILLSKDGGHLPSSLLSRTLHLSLLALSCVQIPELQTVRWEVICPVALTGDHCASSLPKGHLAMSEDIFIAIFWGHATGISSMLLNLLQCTGQVFTTKNYQAKMSIVQRLKNPDLANTRHRPNLIN